MERRSIVILSFDTLGDLILRQPLFRALLDEGYPITVVVRHNYERLLPILDPRLKAITTEINPYELDDPKAVKEVKELRQRIAELRPGTLVSAPYNRTHLDDWLVAQFRNLDRVGFFNPVLLEAPREPFLAAPDKGSIPSSESFSRLVRVSEDSHESVKNQFLLKTLAGRPAREYWPVINVTGEIEHQGNDLVAKLGLEPGRYVLGCPAGTVNVPIKSWPEEDYVDLLTHLHRKHQLPVLLTGLPEESSFLERIAYGAQERGVLCKQWVGSPEDPVSLLGLIRHSCLYLGTDSGPMHLAAALDVPVVALFGGGTWPRFLPLARRSFVATQEVPCFGCDWDCWLDEPICIRKVSVQKFRDALDWILSSAEDERRVDRGEPPEKFSEEIIRRAIPQTRAGAQQLKKQLQVSEMDRSARLRVIHEMAAHRAELTRQLEASEADRAARLEVIKQLDQRVAGLSQQWQAVNQRLDESETHRGEVARELEVSQAARTDLAQKLEASEADRGARLELIHSLQRQIAELATTRAALKRVAVAVATRLRIYSFLKKHQHLCERIYDGLFRIASRAKEVSPAREVIPVAPLDSPQVEAFIVARTLEGEIDDRGLAHLFEMGSQLKHVLCPHPTRAAVQAAYILSKGGAPVTCTSAQECSAELQSYGVAAIAHDLARWMIEAELCTLTDFDGVILDTSTVESTLQSVESTLQSLEGRLSKSARVLILGAQGEEFRFQASWRKPEQQIGNLQIYEGPPNELLDPVQKSPEWYTLKDWPRNRRSLKFPEKLPSGRPWPKISIVTVTYNQGGYLEEALRSVLMQGYPNLEYLVLDGLSTDHAPSILSRYRKDLAYCISEKDEGQSDALNKGLSRATGDILAWLNSDDRYLPGTLMRVALAFDVYGADMVAGGCTLVQDKSTKSFTIHHNSMPLGRTVPLPLNRLLDIEGCWIKGDFFWQPEVFWTRSIWERSGGRVAEDLYYSMDYDLWVRMARAGATIVHIPDTLAIYRMHEGQKTSGEELPYLPELRQVSGEYLKGLK